MSYPKLSDSLWKSLSKTQKSEYLQSKNSNSKAIVINGKNQPVNNKIQTRNRKDDKPRMPVTQRNEILDRSQQPNGNVLQPGRNERRKPNDESWETKGKRWLGHIHTGIKYAKSAWKLMALSGLANTMDQVYNTMIMKQLKVNVDKKDFQSVINSSEAPDLEGKFKAIMQDDEAMQEWQEEKANFVENVFHGENTMKMKLKSIFITIATTSSSFLSTTTASTSSYNGNIQSMQDWTRWRVIFSEYKPLKYGVQIWSSYTPTTNTSLSSVTYHAFNELFVTAISPVNDGYPSTVNQIYGYDTAQLHALSITNQGDRQKPVASWENLKYIGASETYIDTLTDTSLFFVFGGCINATFASQSPAFILTYDCEVEFQFMEG
jgi:hypothetical protein